MGKKYLIDTNAAIDFFGNRLPKEGMDFMESITAPVISVVTEIELLGWYRISPEELEKLQGFVNNASVIQLHRVITKKTISLRQSHKIKLPDAIIAASAISNNLTLITHNTKDFNHLPELKVIDPYKLKKP